MKALLGKLLTTENPTAQTHTVEAFYSVLGALLTERTLGNGGTVNLERQIVQRALIATSEHYRDPDFTTQAMAERIGISLRRLQKTFRAVEETPRNRLQRFRVETARQMLVNRHTQDPALSVTQVAFSCGFGDLSTFYRQYRKSYRRTPGQETGAVQGA